MKKPLMLLPLLVTFAACGSGGGVTPNPTPPTPNATMQQGQWEFVAPSSNFTIYAEANLQDSGDGIFSTSVNTAQYVQVPPNTTAVCLNLTLNGTISGNALTGSFDVPVGTNVPAGNIFTFSATISNNKSVSGGTFSSLGENTACFVTSAHTSGTFQGYTIAPVNGTFTGTLSWGINGQNHEVVVLNLTQGANFSISGSGTDTSSTGVVSTLSFIPSGGTPGGLVESNVIGAILYATGTWKNAMQSSPLLLTGRLNPSATR